MISFKAAVSDPTLPWSGHAEWLSTGATGTSSACRTGESGSFGWVLSARQASFDSDYDLWSFIVWVSWKSSFHFLCCHGPWAASLQRRQAIFDYVHVGGIGPEIRTTSGNSNLATKPWLLAMLPHWKHHLRATPHYHLDNPCSFNPLEKIRIFPPTIFDCQEQGSIDKIKYESSIINLSTNKFLAKKTSGFCWIQSCGWPQGSCISWEVWRISSWWPRCGGKSHNGGGCPHGTKDWKPPKMIKDVQKSEIFGQNLGVRTIF